MKNLVVIFIVLLLACSCDDNLFTDNDITDQDFQLNEIYNILYTNDNHYLITGEFDSKITLIKTNENLRTIWRKNNFNWGTNYSEGWGGDYYSFEPTNIFLNEQGNYIIIGYVAEGSCVVSYSALIIELNQSGNEVKIIKINDFLVDDAIQTSDSGYLLIGNKIAKLDKDLVLLWAKDFSNYEYLPSKIIEIDNESGFAVTGTYNHEEVFLKKLDANGDELWTNEAPFNKVPTNDVGYDIIQLVDQGYIIIGRIGNFHKSYDLECFVIHTNFSGEAIWTMKFGNENDDWLENFIYKSNDRFIIQGKERDVDNNKRSILLDMDKNGQVVDSCYIDEFELLMYNPLGYFLKANKIDENKIRLSKIQFNNLFKQEDN